MRRTEISTPASLKEKSSSLTDRAARLVGNRGGPAGARQLQNCARQFRRTMPELALLDFPRQVPLDDSGPGTERAVVASLDRQGAFSRVSLSNRRTDRVAIDQHVVEQIEVDMRADRCQVVLERIAVGFARLGHQVR